MPQPTATGDAQASALVRAAVGELHRAAGLVAFGGFVAPGRAQVRIAEVAGGVANALPGLAIGSGSGLGGRVIVTARPHVVDDYLVDVGITHEYDRQVAAERLHAIAAAPLVVGRAVCGVLYCGSRSADALGDRALRAMTRVSRTVSFELAVRAEVARRLDLIETTAIREAAQHAPESGCEAVRTAHAEMIALYHDVADPSLRERIRAISTRLTDARGERSGQNPLAPRELDVLALVALGCGNAEIARRLELATETVKAYLRSVARKLGTHSRTESVAVARGNAYLP